MEFSISLFLLCLVHMVVSCRAHTLHQGIIDDNDTITIGSMRYTKEDWEARKNPIDAMKAIREERYRWPKATIPYVLDANFRSEEWLAIQGALDEWHKYTCLTFKHRADEKNYINVQRYSGCSAYVGMRGWGEQLVKAGSCTTHNGFTELFGFTVGFEIESLRPDRDDYLEVLWDNVNPEHKIDMEALSMWQVDTMEVPYDYTSITSFYEKAYTKNYQYITLKARDERFQDIMGYPNGLSFQDIHLANKMYKCSSHCLDSEVECPYGGFLGKDCKCWCDSEKPYDKICECGTAGCMGNTTHPKCRDLRVDCERWASNGECQYKPSFMLYECPRACGLCGENASCTDFHSDCEYYKQRGYCTTEDRNNRDFAHRYCRETCQFC